MDVVSVSLSRTAVYMGCEISSDLNGERSCLPDQVSCGSAQTREDARRRELERLDHGRHLFEPPLIERDAGLFARSARAALPPDRVRSCKVRMSRDDEQGRIFEDDDLAGRREPGEALQRCLEQADLGDERLDDGGPGLRASELGR